MIDKQLDELVSVGLIFLSGLLIGLYIGYYWLLQIAKNIEDDKNDSIRK